MQLVMATENATLTSAGGDKDDYSVFIQPKLRKDFSGNFVRFANPKGLFRLVSSEVNWKADHISNYGISFAVIEVI